ncbi:C40 family peptidase [Desulfovibrio sp. OttesenSCG-928-C14]|nr:C40 family peptidase [Desulfovibrio sp. OttesenSCG-928-C14]
MNRPLTLSTRSPLPRWRILPLICLTMLLLSTSACAKQVIHYNPDSRKIHRVVPEAGKQQVSTPSKTRKLEKQKLPVTARAEAICKTAASQLGKTYRYGGTNPKSGFDCSGLLVWAFNQHGVALPRTAREQSSAGRKVDKKSLAIGDVVVFKISSGYHTGIYMGNGQFIHSPSRGKKIRYDSLSQGYWSKRYYSARRVI